MHIYLENYFYPTGAILQRKNREYMVVKPQQWWLNPSRIITLQCVLKPHTLQYSIIVLYHIYQSRSKRGIEANLHS